MKDVTSAPKSLHKMLSDPRIVDFSDETSMEQGYWVYLDPKYQLKGNPGSTIICEHSVKGILSQWNGGRDLERQKGA